MRERSSIGNKESSRLLKTNIATVEMTELANQVDELLDAARYGDCGDVQVALDEYKVSPDAADDQQRTGQFRCLQECIANLVGEQVQLKLCPPREGYRTALLPYLLLCRPSYGVRKWTCRCRESSAGSRRGELIFC